MEVKIDSSIIGVTLATLERNIFNIAIGHHLDK